MYIKRILLIIALLGLVVLGYFSYRIYDNIFTPNTAFEAESVTIYIPTGANYATVKDSLRPHLKDIASFEAVAEKKGYSPKAGKFVITKGMNNNSIINTLRLRGLPVKVVFNNQERLENLAGRISTQIEADSISLLEVMRDTSFLYGNGFTNENALGMYIPNQYEFFWNTSAEGFRKRMQREYNNFWTPERLQKAEEIGLTPQQVTVIASIVQKETAKVDERAKVAGVYMNRYKNGWKLDADPTVIYAIKLENDNFDTIIKRVLYKDLTLDSPYNTYLYKELPPGPIAMPDISSIDAVLNYEDHKYFYFVADVENFGYHKFAETLAQHNRNKQAYIRWINKQGINR
ncbi:endolytic transglycosylase MltG [Antarcticibacterium flavum]|uniref:Endolytic murein transglycosylase n=1 Tax=Antarcticibacterium flavum TaxID=2058175 RepID=A0A5B7X552_9FLAO|nr:MULTISPECIES: endolytic transglycosylase MltG [Antarcticibacterium]MCM4161084.1 endolytic transglycosylase MltG [Antarcticibacterium sp. W02-3]QCY70489.1 endolytic transglycosylase MltG [Antarcticibacterium flavum]